jgi:hypothetical protein
MYKNILNCKIILNQSVSVNFSKFVCGCIFFTFKMDQLNIYLVPNNNSLIENPFDKQNIILISIFGSIFIAITIISIFVFLGGMYLIVYYSHKVKSLHVQRTNEKELSNMEN